MLSRAVCVCNSRVCYSYVMRVRVMVSHICAKRFGDSGPCDATTMRSLQLQTPHTLAHRYALE